MVWLDLIPIASDTFLTASFKVLLEVDILSPCVINYYDSMGIRIRQEFIKQVRPDGYDTISFKTEVEPGGKTYTKDIKENNMPKFLLQE